MLPSGGGGSASFGGWGKSIGRKTSYLPSLYGLRSKKRAKKGIINQILSGFEVRYRL